MNKLSIFVNDVSIGVININQYDFLDTCINICNEENTNLLHIYSQIKINIEDNVLKLINNNTNVYNEIVLKINEWGLNIKPNDIFNTNSVINIDNYDKFEYLNMEYNDINKNKNLESINKLKENLLTYKKIYNHNILYIEPNYNYLLIDISNIKEYNLNNIFINYLLLINFAKKELHYLKGIIESILNTL